MTLKPKVLLLTSARASIDMDGLARGETPRRDYAELARVLNAEICDFGQVLANPFGRLLSRIIGKGPTHALLGLRRLNSGFDSVFTDSEHVGLFLGILLRLKRTRPRHVLLAHHLTPLKKRPFELLARPGIDCLLLHSDAQKHLAINKLGFSGSRVIVLPYQVDTRFWNEEAQVTGSVVSTAGLECRDYPTLMRAITGLAVDVRIGAASNWSRKKSRLTDSAIPSNASISSYNYRELRDLYAHSRFVVVPLLDVDFQAGITLILEAMAMARAVVVTRTKGQAGAVVGPLWHTNTREWPEVGPQIEQSTGIYVQPGDAAAMRSAFSFLLSNPEIADRLGRNGRKLAHERYSIEDFVARIQSVLDPGVGQRLDAAAGEVRLEARVVGGSDD